MMDERDLKPNSHKYRDAYKNDIPEKRVGKVISGTAKVKKKNELQKMGNMLISEDARNVKSYVLMDVLLPAIKKAVVDIVTDGIHMIFYGETGHSRNSSHPYNVSYNKYSSMNRDYDRRNYYSSGRTKSDYSYDDLILESRGEAEEVLTTLLELIDTYGSVSVADLYETVGVTGEYTDNKYGWYDLRTADTARVRDGYVLRLPRAVPLD